MQQWYVMYTKPHKEPLINRQLEAKGLQTYFPFFQVDRGYRRGIRVEPMFPNYLFFRADLQTNEGNGLRTLPGLRTIVQSENGPNAVYGYGPSFIENFDLHTSAAHTLTVQTRNLIYKATIFGHVLAPTICDPGSRIVKRSPLDRYCGAWHSLARWISTVSLGLIWDCSASLVPWPPAKMPTFILSLLVDQ